MHLIRYLKHLHLFFYGPAHCTVVQILQSIMQKVMRILPTTSKILKLKTSFIVKKYACLLSIGFKNVELSW